MALFIGCFVAAIILEVLYFGLIKYKWLPHVWKNFRLNLKEKGFKGLFPRRKLRQQPLVNPGKSQNKFSFRSFLLSLSNIVEILLIALWAMWVGRAYLDFNSNHWPASGEFSLTTVSHYNWIHFENCGVCMFWNGSLQGGAPSFADMQSSFLSPVVAIPTLLFGVVNGAKVALVLSFFLAGLAQWWIAKIIGSGRVGRLFTAALAVAGGNLAGKMQLGAVGLVISTAACSLVLAPALDLALHQRWRSAAWLGITLGLAMLAGQAYMQIGLLLCYLPAFFICFARKDWWRKHVWHKVAVAALIALCISAVYWVPLMHFFPNIGKPTDIAFSSPQQFLYIPTNLVIHDFGFYQNTDLGKLALPSLYINYIGWIPVLLAGIGVVLHRRQDRRLVLFCLLAFMLVWLASSGLTFKLLFQLTVLAANVRFSSFISGLMIPLVLTLATLGIKCIDERVFNPLLKVRQLGWRVIVRFVVQVPVIALLGYALWSVYTFGQDYLQTQLPFQTMVRVMDELKTPTAEWVDFVDPNNAYLLPAAEYNLKLSSGFRTWGWLGRELPKFVLQATWNKVETTDPAIKKIIDPYTILQYPHNEYASVETGTAKVACSAQAEGGKIDVTCQNQVGGVLTVQENTWSGWHVYVDGKPAALITQGTQWLQVKALAGSHTYQFRYQPWDVWVGIGLSWIGLLLALYFGRKKEAGSSPAS